MTKEQFKAELVLKVIENTNEYPKSYELEAIQKLADFVFSGE